MGLFRNAVGGAVISRLINQRRGPWHQRHFARRRAPVGFFGGPIGRLGLGSLAFFALRGILARQRHA